MEMLLSVAQAAVDEEFARAERLDSKARGLLAIVGAFFAFAQATTIGLLSGPVDPDEARGWALAIVAVAGLSAVGMLLAIGLGFWVFRLRDEKAPSVVAIRDYGRSASVGHPAVGIKLSEQLAKILEDRREVNRARSKSLTRMAVGCAFAVFCAAAQFGLGLVAVIFG